MIKLTFLFLTATVALAACAPPVRWQRADLNNGSAPDLRGCMYEAYKADRWGDNEFVDRCMERHGYFIDRERSNAIWWPGMKTTFAELDARKGNASSNAE